LFSDDSNKGLEATWGGWSDEENEGEYVSLNDPSFKMTPDMNHLWYLYEPNGDVAENCAAFFMGHGFIDFPCEKRFCAICDIRDPPVFVMRGMCPGTLFDYHYSWTGMLTAANYLNEDGGVENEQKKYSFSGFASSDLSWDQNLTSWVLRRDNQPFIYATTNGTYPFGTNMWHFVNDTCVGDEDNLVANDTYQVKISFSSCTDDQFNCDDGSW
jgi:hypothetical protein